MNLFDHVTSAGRRATQSRRPADSVTRHPLRVSAFTMVEIAISLAVIGIALVSILSFLPLGMQVQKDNREQTVLNQDATIFIEAIRSGAHGTVELTNYVYAITNYWTKYSGGSAGASQVNGYDFAHNPQVAAGYYTATGHNLTNDAVIIGLLSTPEFTDGNGEPIYFPNDNNGVVLYPTNSGDIYFSNHVVAYVHSLSGPAVEKPPQDNPLLVSSSFGYKLYSVNAPLAIVTNSFGTAYGTNLTANLHELRLTFFWPLQPNNAVGPNLPITYRATIAGRFTQDTNWDLAFYHSQFFSTNNVAGP